MELSVFFESNPMAALAFSGGVDSSYLLYAAVECGADVRAYYVKSAFQPQFELEDAKRLASHLNVEITILDADVLNCPQITQNSADRCYHCKRLLFSIIAESAAKDGYSTLLDGTNASDDAEDRPGMRAVRELSVRSPLRECGLTKDDIRNRSRQAGLFTWNKPAYSCLATRIPTGEIITGEKLKRTEHAEDYLFSLGFSDFRVRSSGDTARLQFTSSQLALAMNHRRDIVRELKKGYASVLLDMEARDE